MHVPFFMHEVTGLHHPIPDVTSAVLRSSLTLEELIVVIQGHPVHRTERDSVTISEPCFIHVPSGRSAEFIPDATTKAWVIHYSPELIPGAVFHVASHFSDKSYQPLRQPGLLGRLSALCQMIQEEYGRETPDYAIIKHLLTALLAMVESQRRDEEEQNMAKNQHLQVCNQFFKLLEEHYRSTEGVQFYADRLSISIRHLNAACAAVLNKNVSELIENRKIAEAKHLLADTDKLVSEIGFELGYSEKSYFTRVFRKKAGCTPSEFRVRSQAVMG